ncbi:MULTISPECIES: ParB/RepB/Spo0J family partition protein [Hymenobacter]|uniref:ParB/RepB/Spo0J family partition protein n=1 Tax=Hymenobacter guriensis TaxID=2793065 RepID=A0ABS0L7L1_9BACT|nr:MULTISPECIES: ParB/RepB/Spo0J family partition protein [Hymenobacter]MBG8555347.1 ParB/RepB/Spo0J family partition protein [Hymenobacter guriensis]MCR5889026.1 ParB/RepB/Spo0J family partition protein [Hymenobacter sp. J193]
MSEKPEEKSTPAAAPKRKIGGLGRGLNALIEGSYEKKSERLVSHPVNSVGLIPVGQIQANPYQPRTHFDQDALQELAESIKVQGIIQPVTVRQTGTNAYQLISGERRLQASKLAGLDAIPAYIRKADDQQMLEMALIENIQRENLNAIEIALSYQRLVSECNLKQEELGDRVGKNRSTVTNYLRLLKLPPDIQIGLRDAVISMGHARALISIDDTEQQLALFRRIVAEELSVRRVEQLVRNGGSTAKPGTPEAQPTEEQSLHIPVAELRRTERHLSERFGSRVMVKPGPQGRGEIKIAFDSVEDMQRILHILQPA